MYPKLVSSVEKFCFNFDNNNYTQITYNATVHLMLYAFDCSAAKRILSRIIDPLPSGRRPNKNTPLHVSLGK